MQNRYAKDLTQVDWAARITKLATNAGKPIQELYDGVRTRTLPLGVCLLAAIVLQFFVYMHWDRHLAYHHGFGWMYPVRTRPFLFYYLFVVTSPFWFWAVGKALEKERLVKRLTEAFKSVGLKNNMGKLPNFVFDRPLDEVTRKLRLTRSALPLETFQKTKNALEGVLQIYIDEIKEDRAKGTVDIIYAHKAMPESFVLSDVSHVPELEFIVGTTRSQEMRANLNHVPHLLVAGQTGGGKSTFLRQFITTLYLNDRKSAFTLVDLKGGLEFQTFEDLPGITVVPNVKGATYELMTIASTIEARMNLLRANKCKDIIEYIKLPADKRTDAEGVPKDTALNRHFIVIDEAAEMFLAGHHASTKDVTSARKILSQVARQGRSIGIHLVVATQRPDSRALDPQVKANLTGVLCFQMVNDISSITVLGTGRATDLPPIPGRAIWKSSLEAVEVQTPFLSTTEADKLLAPRRRKQAEKPQTKADQNPVAPGTTKNRKEPVKR